MAGIIRAYLRVSTANQTVSGQSHEVMQYIQKNKMKLDEVVEETVSGTKSYKERALGDLIERSRKGDIILVTELSRLGRSMLEILQILNVLSEKEVAVHSIKEGYKLDDSLFSKLYSYCLGMCSEVEKSLISMRTREALAARRAAGVQLGRPKGSLSKSMLTDKEQEIRGLLAKESISIKY